MSFDPITLAMAKKYTDEKVGGSGGEAIYLGEYGPSPYTINLVVLMLASEGGGTFTFESGMEKFWTDVLTKQPDYLIFDLGDTGSARLTIGGLAASAAALESGDAVVCAIGILSMYGMNIDGCFVFTQEGETGLKVSVKADFIEFPNYTPEL